MKRFPAFDPPEYVEWRPDPTLQSAFTDTLTRDPERRAILEALDPDLYARLYAGMVRFRLHDIALKRWVRTGTISKAWLGTGEEAVTIGSVHALERGDMAAPMIRNAGACHEMGMPLSDMFRGYLATGDGPTQGRDLHFGDLKYGIIAPISHLGAVLPVTVGAALGFKLKHQSRVAMTWVGDGSTKTGDFHEGVNLAAVQEVPAVIIIQNNQVALGTRVQQHHRGKFEDFARVYGMAGGTFDGNNVLDAYAACKIAVDRARRGGGPTLLVAETFRMGGHATHDEREARECFPAELFQHWGQRDPIGMFEEHLIETGRLTRADLTALEAEVAAEVEKAAEEALASRATCPADASRVLEGVYAPS